VVLEENQKASVPWMIEDLGRSMAELTLTEDLATDSDHQSEGSDDDSVASHSVAVDVVPEPTHDVPAGSRMSALHFAALKSLIVPSDRECTFTLLHRASDGEQLSAFLPHLQMRSNLVFLIYPEAPDVGPFGAYEASNFACGLRLFSLSHHHFDKATQIALSGQSMQVSDRGSLIFGSSDGPGGLISQKLGYGDGKLRSCYHNILLSALPKGYRGARVAGYALFEGQDVFRAREVEVFRIQDYVPLSRLSDWVLDPLAPQIAG